MLLNICGKFRHLDDSVVISIAVMQGIDERRSKDAMAEFANCERVSRPAGPLPRAAESCLRRPFIDAGAGVTGNERTRPASIEQDNRLLCSDAIRDPVVKLLLTDCPASERCGIDTALVVLWYQ